MSLEVGPEKTFTHLTAEEAEELYTCTRDLVVRGTISSEVRPYFRAWCEATGTTDNILTLSTAFTQRALLSVIGFREAQAKS
jgi:hypothetical protein